MIADLPVIVTQSNEAETLGSDELVRLDHLIGLQPRPPLHARRPRFPRFETG